MSRIAHVVEWLAGTRSGLLVRFLAAAIGGVAAGAPCVAQQSRVAVSGACTTPTCVAPPGVPIGPDPLVLLLYVAIGLGTGLIVAILGQRVARRVVAAGSLPASHRGNIGR